MPYKNADQMSAGAVAAAKRQGRFYNNRVYGTKREADDARRTVKNTGGSKRGSQKGPAPTTARETEVIKIELRKSDATAAKEFMYDVHLNGAGVHAQLAALKGREPVVLGARWEISFDLTKEIGRWSVATVSSLSSGRKTPQQVAKVEGAKAFDSITWVDKWVAVTGINRLSSPTDDSGNTLVANEDVRIAVLSVEMTDNVNVSISLHVTVELRKAGVGVHTL